MSENRTRLIVWCVIIRVVLTMVLRRRGFHKGIHPYGPDRRIEFQALEEGDFPACFQ